MTIATLDATPFLYQLKNVVARNNTALWRSPDYVFSRLFVHAITSLSISLSFLNLGDSVRDLQYRVFGMSVVYIFVSLYFTSVVDYVFDSFWVIVLPVIVMVQIEPMFIFNRSRFLSSVCSSHPLTYKLLSFPGVFIRGL